jgi:hypothetical protein
LYCERRSQQSAGSDASGADSAAQHKFGELLYTIELLSWVHAMAWHPGGRLLAVVTHDSSVHLISPLHDGAFLRFQFTLA